MASPEVKEELARWTHMWFAAAHATLENLEGHWDDTSPATSIGRRDVLCLVLVDAVQNVYRGARAVLPKKSEAIKAFQDDVPGIQDLRNRFEHFDEYVRGQGNAQRGAGISNTVTMSVVASTGGIDGHSIMIEVAEGSDRESRRQQIRREDAARVSRWCPEARRVVRRSELPRKVSPVQQTTRAYELSSRGAVRAARQLVQKVLEHVGLAGSRHASCRVCFGVEG